MIKDSSKLKKGQTLKVELTEVEERLSKNVLKQIQEDPLVELVGYKMVDGNQFGLAVKLKDGDVNWFFENELSEVL